MRHLAWVAVLVAGIVGAAFVSGALLEFAALVQAIGWYALIALAWPAFMLFAVFKGWGDHT